ncbi:hypothetical protein [Pseudomonas sp. PGPR40]|uniref:hypothetical protein n=1 Tax=Pseudomonas sp. PGPR40 TaxID=2913476 RepID=UPI001ED9D839|nr:hypothetical protein [Pseudomonas sp. PGPR40]
MLKTDRKLRYISSCCFTPKFQVLDIQTGRRKSCFVFFAIDSVTGRILHYALGYDATVTETIDDLIFVKHGIWCVTDKRLPPLDTIKLLRSHNLKASKCFMPALNENINDKDANEAFLPSSKLIARSRVSRLNLLDFKMLESFVIHCIYDWPQNVLCRICKPNEIASDVVNDIVELAVQRVNALLERKPTIFCTRAPQS